MKSIFIADEKLTYRQLRKMLYGNGYDEVSIIRCTMSRLPKGKVWLKGKKNKLTHLVGIKLKQGLLDQNVFIYVQQN